MATVAQRIRRRRLELGLSQRAAACEGVSAAHICRLERGDRQPSAKALRALAKRLETSVHWLETGEDDPAHELARLVVDARGNPVPPRARTLAQMILKRANA
jgi:transcriptional regulator with XRE-family HTH domain